MSKVGCPCDPGLGKWNGDEDERLSGHCQKKAIPVCSAHDECINKGLEVVIQLFSQKWRFNQTLLLLVEKSSPTSCIANILLFQGVDKNRFIYILAKL